MGCISSGENKLESEKSRAIDRELKKTQMKSQKQAKILLLGAGECGKSTIVKQMKILHMGGYTDEEKMSFLPIIYANILLSMHNLVKAMAALEIPYENETNQEVGDEIVELVGRENPQLFKEVSSKVMALWEDAGIQQAFHRRNEFQLSDSTPYYMERIETIAKENYTPDVHDIVMSRVKTSGIIENQFNCKGLTITLIDVGGQRSERKKWINCFENIQAILFITALSEYNLTLEEDGVTNRMKESIKLFDSICNNKFFLNTAIIVFFNKKDLFADKIEKYPFKDYFEEYDGANEFDAIINYVERQFMSQNRNPQKRIYPHLTTATDTSNIDFVFSSVVDVIANLNLQDVGLL